MPDYQLENIHLAFVEDLLPIGMAIFDRAKKGGAGKVIEGFTASNDPIKTLRAEGSFPAKLVRDKLDKIRPGLGNPVVEVKVDINPEDLVSEDSDDTLSETLKRIRDRLDLIDSHSDDSIDLNL